MSLGPLTSTLERGWGSSELGRRSSYLSDLRQNLANQRLPLRILKTHPQLPCRKGLLQQQAGLGLRGKCSYYAQKCYRLRLRDRQTPAKNMATLGGAWGLPVVLGSAIALKALRGAGGRRPW